MLTKASRYTVQQIYSELKKLGVGVINHALLSHLQEGTLVTHICFPTYVNEGLTELTSDYWKQFSVDEVNFAPPRTPTESELMIDGSEFLAEELQRLKSLAKSAIKRDPTRIDPKLLDASKDILSSCENARPESFEALMPLMFKLLDQLLDEAKGSYGIYVLDQDWQRFRTQCLASSGSNAEVRERGKPGRKESFAWTALYEELISMLMSKSDVTSVYGHLGLPSISELARELIAAVKRRQKAVPIAQ